MAYKVHLGMQEHLVPSETAGLRVNKAHVENQDLMVCKDLQDHKEDVVTLDLKAFVVRKEVRETKEPGARKDTVDSQVFKVFLDHRVNLEILGFLDKLVHKVKRVVLDLMVHLGKTDCRDLQVLQDRLVLEELVVTMDCRDHTDLQDLVVNLDRLVKLDTFLSHRDILLKDQVASKVQTVTLKTKQSVVLRSVETTKSCWRLKTSAIQLTL